MAASPYAWGIDIGKCSLKALRCRISPTDPRRLVVEASECIEYPMMLTQPEADATELVRTALAELASRHSFVGDRVAVSAAGQSGLAKFIKLPPVEAKKIPDIVRYEAGQQIPFPLDQVIWDWQRLAAGMEEGGFVMDAEVALFAMKREQVAKSLAPLQTADIEVDVLQLTPIALANMVMFDQLPDPKTIDQDNPPDSIVLVSIGVDSTDLVVTNGLRVWQRSMPIGGSSFTKALVQEMKFTFAKAEQQKRNAVRASDPRAVFKAMRPVFNQFASELQRSLNYFTGADRSAKIGRVLLAGNAAKLRGLADFVAKQLQLDVQRLDKFTALEGPALASQAFRENRLSFGTAYGLALQAAGGAGFQTNLLPREIAFDRMVAAKRPWVVAAALGLLAAGLVNFAGMFVAAGSHDPARFDAARQAAENVQRTSAAAEADLEAAQKRLEDTARWQRYLVEVHDRRFQSLDLVRAVTSILPRDEEGKVPENPADRNEIHIDALDMEYFPDLAVWFNGVADDWRQTLAAAEAAGRMPAPTAPPTDPAAAGADPAADPAAVAADPAAADASAQGAPAEGSDPAGAAGEPGATPAGPSGPGWVVQIRGHHFRNEPRHAPRDAENFVREEIVHDLLPGGCRVTVTAGPKQGEEVDIAELGIGYPVIVDRTAVRRVRVNATPQVEGSGVDPIRPPGEEEVDQSIELRRYDFLLQFSWQPITPGASPRPRPAPAEAEPSF